MKTIGTVATGYPVHNFHNCIPSHVEPKDWDEWSECPCCGLRPKVWVFNNGRSTACGCWMDQYDHFSVNAESIISVHTRTAGKPMEEYKQDDLRQNWNHWCATGKILFPHAGLRSDGRW